MKVIIIWDLLINFIVSVKGRFRVQEKNLNGNNNNGAPNGANTDENHSSIEKQNKDFSLSQQDDDHKEKLNNIFDIK